jgi:ABC-type multidrug transport system fused ATPase/permease subunit
MSKAFLDREISFGGQYSKDVFQALYFSYRSKIARMICFVVTGLLGRILLLSNANLIGVWVDSFCFTSLKSGNQIMCKAIPKWSAGFSNRDFLILLVVVSSIGFVLTAIFRIGFSRTSAQAISGLYDEVTLRTSRLPIGFFDQNPVGRIVTRFSSDYSNVFRLFGGPLAEFLAVIFDLISMFILIVVASPYFLPIFVFIGSLNFLVYRLNRARLRRERRELSASRSPSIAHFAETTQGASTIRIFARRGEFFRRFQDLNDYYLRQRLKTSKVVFSFSMQMSFMTAILLLVTGLSGFFMARSGFASIGSIGVAFTFIVLSGTSLQMFFDWMAQFEEAMTGVERLNDYLRRPLESGAKLPAMRRFETSHPVFLDGEEELNLRHRLVKNQAAGVSVKNLWFRYGEDMPYVLKGIDLQIKAGEKIGIVGRTGSGKTSLVQALFQLYPIDKGSIEIDGKSPKTNDLAQYRRAIALISQEPTLFRGSLRENLDLLNTRSDREVLESIHRVGLSAWLETQIYGLSSAIEERGRNLSAGERQLLCMARCLLQDAPVVVMDEATSAVDPQSEEILVKATREFFSDRTQIIIAHRLSTLEDCDRIVWLHNGEVKMFAAPHSVIPAFRNSTVIKNVNGDHQTN